MEVRIWGHGRGSSAMTRKDGNDAVHAQVDRTSRQSQALVSDRIPETHTNIVEGSAWGRLRVNAAHEVYREQERSRHRGCAEPDAWTEFGEVGPSLTAGIGGDVGVPVELSLQSFESARGIAEFV